MILKFTQLEFLHIVADGVWQDNHAALTLL